MQINGSNMRKLMSDAGWGKFMNYVGYKPESAGKRVVHVDPKGTTQECSLCGRTVFKTLSERMHRCRFCGAVMPRDYKATGTLSIVV